LSLTVRALIHFGAIVLQGACLVLLLQTALTLTSATLILVGITCLGAGLAYSWFRWTTITHTLDMMIEMLTLGNAGMLLGWWVDNGFESVHCAACCSCTDPLTRPWMWIGM